MRKIEIDLHELLDIVIAAEDYGYSDDSLLSWFGDFIGELTDNEIEQFASWFKSDEAKKQRYTEEDYEDVKNKLKLFRDKYCNGKNKN